jgi:hypothetical protein
MSTMLIVTLPGGGQPAPHVFGCIGCNLIAPVTAYQLVQARSKNATVVTSLDDYSRWTEPAFGLLARLLSRRGSGASERESDGAVDCAILLGRDLYTSRPIERLVGRVEDGLLHVSLSSELGAHVDAQPARSHYARVGDLIEHAARIAVWGADAEPPMPPPLTAVPIRYGDGAPHVLEADMPPHPRRYFVARQAGRTQPDAGAHFARDWRAFIGA